MVLNVFSNLNDSMTPQPQSTTRTLSRTAGLKWAAQPAPGTARSHQGPHNFPGQAKGTHRGRDPPAPHARDLEAALLDLLTRQPHLEVELVVACADNDMASLLREVGDAGVELEIAIVLQGLCQADELRAEPRSSTQQPHLLRQDQAPNSAPFTWKRCQSSAGTAPVTASSPLLPPSWRLFPAGTSAAGAAPC